MKPAIPVGIILIVVGVVSLAYQGITYTTLEKSVDLGPLQITSEKSHTIPLPPILGALTLIAGVGLLIANKH